MDRAAGTDHPGDVDAADAALVETFEFRRDGVAAIAEQLPNAIADQGDRSGGSEADRGRDAELPDQRRALPDPLHPAPRDRAQDERHRREGARSNFLPDIEWLQPRFVADRVRSLGGTGGDGDAAPGLHGNGIAGVTLGGQALNPAARRASGSATTSSS